MCKVMQCSCIFILLLSGRIALTEDTPQPEEQEPETGDAVDGGQISPDEQELQGAPEGPSSADDQELEEADQYDAGLGDAGEEEPEIKIKGPDWIIMLAPSAGWIKNKVTTKFTIPVDTGDKVTELTMTDDAWGPGLVAMAMYKWFVLVNVVYYFPEINHSWVVGGISQLSVTIPTPIFVKPYLAAGLFYQVSKTDMGSFVEDLDSEMSHPTNPGEIVPTTGYAYFDDLKVDVRILNPFPEIGAKFMIPIQHWYITPYYSFWYDDVKTHARSSSGGDVFIYKRGQPRPKERPPADITTNKSGDGVTTPYMYVDTGEFSKKSHRAHPSHLVGAWASIDLWYFLQLQANFYYNINDQLFSFRLIGTALFSKYVGLSAYFEYQDLRTVDNVFFFIGPCFVFFPPGWFDNLMAMKDRKKD